MGEIFDTVLDILVIFLAITISFLNFQVPLVTYGLPAGLLIVAMMFIFAATLQEMVNGLYMLFFVRPFNIGDLVRIGSHMKLFWNCKLSNFVSLKKKMVGKC